MTGWEPFVLASAKAITVAVIVLQLARLLFLVLQLGFAWIALRERPPHSSTTALWRRYGDVAPPITIIAPAYNEGRTIVESVEALLSLQYPAFDIIVVNDGSSDDTLQQLCDRFALKPVQRLCEQVVEHKPIRGFFASPRTPRLLVVDKEPGGSKADAVNAGISASRAPLICVTDGDTVMNKDTLLRAVWPFIDEPGRTIAVGGTIAIANGSRIERGRMVEERLPRRFLALVQVVEYLRAFMMARLGLSRMNALTIISGAFGLFDRQALVAVGGYSPASLGEDFDLTIKLHRHCRELGRPYAIRFVPEPIVWTEAPENLGDLGRQRMRWQRGALQTFWDHRQILFRPRYGPVALIGFGQVLVIDVIGPAVMMLGYVAIPAFWLLGLLSLDFFLAFLSVVFSLGVLLSVVTLVLEEILIGRIPRARDMAILSLIAVIEYFGYRQLCNWWRLRGWYQYLRGHKGWGKMTRQGFAKR